MGLLRLIFLSVVGLVLLLGGGALATWLYYRFYRRHVNRVLEEEKTVLDPAPAPHTAGKIVSVLLVCFGFTIVVMTFFSTLQEIKGHVLALREELSNLGSKLMDLENLQQAQNSLFLTFEHDVSDLDLQSRSVTMRFRAIPKESTTSATVTLNCGELILPLVRQEGGVYTASVKLDPFQLPDLNGTTLCLQEKGSEKYETVELYLYEEIESCVPKLDLSFDRLDISPKGENALLSLQSPRLYVSSPEQIRSPRLLVKQADRVLKEMDLSAVIYTDIGNSNDLVLQTEFSNQTDTVLALHWQDEAGLGYEFDYGCIDCGEMFLTFWSGAPIRIYNRDGSLLGTLRYD